MKFCTFWEGKKDRNWARCRLVTTTSVIILMLRNIFWSIRLARIFCLEVMWAILPSVLIIYPFHRKQNPLRSVQNWTQCSRRVLTRADQRELFHCWLHSCSCCPVAFLSIKIPSFFPAKLLSSELDPSLYWFIGLYFPRGRIWHSILLDFMKFQSAHFSSLLRALCIVALPSTLLSAPLVFYHQQICCKCFPSPPSGH